jgi:nucleotide-binding universal stress UspA family protein
MEGPKIVVGVDGSPSSLAALRWAAREAQRRGVDLEVTLAYNRRVPGAPRTSRPQLLKDVVDLTSSLVESAVNQARLAAPHTHVRGAVLVGAAAPVLIEAAKTADLLVVGSRGGGGFASLLAGSVSARVTSHASCPVVVVRRDGNGTGPVVVGVDGSDSADVATGFAFAEASRRGCPLTAVRAFSLPAPPDPPEPPPLDSDPAGLPELVDQLADWRDKYPDVPTDYVLRPGGAGSVLAAASRQAQLVVVGTRGHGAASSLLLGSVGPQLLHHAECPVMIARARPGA